MFRALDTFASKVAAIQDEYADASVGNVTGSNAVNVFLGIGIAWTLAAIYHEFLKPATDSHCPGLIKKHGTCHKFFVDPGRSVLVAQMILHHTFYKGFIIMIIYFQLGLLCDSVLQCGTCGNRSNGYEETQVRRW